MKIKFHLIIIALAILLAVIFTWPFAANLNSYYTDDGDYALAGSVLWWNQDSFKTGRIFDKEAYSRGFQFYPQPMTMASINHSLIPSVIFSPIYWVTNNFPLSVNLFTLLTFILSFIFSFYTINYFVKNTYAAIIGATIYTFNPLTFARFPEHLDILNKYFLPLVFLFFYKFLKQPNLKDSGLFGLFFTLNALSVNYYQIFTVVVLPIIAIPVLWCKLKDNETGYVTKLLKSSLVWVIFLPILLYFNLTYLEFSKLEGATRSIGETVYFSARLIDYISPAPDNWLYQEFKTALDPYRSPKDPNSGIFNYQEHTLGLNILPIILFILGIIFLQTKKIDASFKPVIWTFLIITFVFSLGPVFVGWNSDSGILQLPFYLLYEYFPFFKGIRAPSRFEFLFYIPFTIIAAYGMVSLLEKYHRLKILILIFCLSLIFIESYSVKDFSNRSQILNKLATIPPTDLSFLADRVVLHIPINNPDIGKESGYLNWATQTHEKIINGNLSYLPTDQLQFLEEVKKLDEDTFKKLTMIGADYIVIHQDLINNYQQLYAPLEHFYAFGKIYDDNNIIIIDLHKYQLDYQLCDFNKDISTELKQVISEDENMISGFGLVIKNNGTCYLPTILSERYRKMSVNIEGQHKTAYFKLPVLIGPMAELVLTELNHELRVE